MAERIGEQLLREGLITSKQLLEALDEQKRSGGRLGYNLTRLGYLKEKDLTAFLGRQYGTNSIDLTETKLNKEIAQLIPEDTAKKYQLLPVGRTDSKLIVAMADPSNVFAIDDIKLLTGFNVECVVASEGAIKIAIREAYEATEPYSESGTGDLDLSDDDNMGDDMDGLGVPPNIILNTTLKTGSDTGIGSILNSVHDIHDIHDISNTYDTCDTPDTDGTFPGESASLTFEKILTEAQDKGSSGIHMEPLRDGTLRVRLRIDGVLTEVMRQPAPAGYAIVSAVKSLCSLDQVEAGLPREGTFWFAPGKGPGTRVTSVKAAEGSELIEHSEWQLSILPTNNGDKLHLRPVYKDTEVYGLDALGLEESTLELLKGELDKEHGMILVSGPGGSGKRTTRYVLAAELNSDLRCVSTVESAPGVSLNGVNQLRLRPEFGLDYPAALRSVIRQDPDVVMIEELQGYETAHLALECALTEHLILSSIRARSASAAVARLLGMGVEPFLVASGCNMILAQRLVRKICTVCREPLDKLDLMEIIALLGTDKAKVPPGLPFEDRDKPVVTFAAKGCKSCGGTGYKGRVLLFEAMRFTDGVKEAILKGLPEREVEEIAVAEGMITLKVSGALKVARGLSTLDEVSSIT